jgi:hypothetical protein
MHDYQPTAWISFLASTTSPCLWFGRASVKVWPRLAVQFSASTSSLAAPTHLQRNHNAACARFAGTDHHFHFGYWVAAAAAIAARDLPWYRAHLEPAVKALIRDYANNDANDPVFPFARHKDW